MELTARFGFHVGRYKPHARVFAMGCSPHWCWDASNRCCSRQMKNAICQCCGEKIIVPHLSNPNVCFGCTEPPCNDSPDPGDEQPVILEIPAHSESSRRRV